MNDKKHIDRIFQERFKDFEVTPNDAVWKAIEAELNQKNKKQRIIPIWWRYAGAAALFLLFLTLGNLYYNTPIKPNTNRVVDTEKTRSINNSDNSNTNQTKIATQNDNSTKTIAEDPNFKEPKLNIVTNKTSVSKTSTVSKTNDSKNKTNLISNRKKGGLKTESQEKTHNIANNHSEEKNKNTTIPKNNNEIDNALINEEKARKLIADPSQNNTAVAETKKNETIDTNNNAKENKNSIEEALNKNKDIVEEKNNSNKWRIVPNVAPVYFNTLGEGSSIDQQFSSNSKTGEINMSYGINASYAINKKLSVRSGINKVNLGYNTNNVVVFQSVGASSSNGLLINVTPETTNRNALDNNISVISGETLDIGQSPKNFATSTASINQSLGYIEVPLEIEYVLINKKVGVHVIGGFSSLFLNGNSIFSENENGSKILLGKANNINKISYSANFGLGFNYEVSKKIDFNLEPLFKYQINTFSNTSGDFKPFFIGVYTGFAIKF